MPELGLRPERRWLPAGHRPFLPTLPTPPPSPSPGPVLNMPPPPSPALLYIWRLVRKYVCSTLVVLFCYGYGYFDVLVMDMACMDMVKDCLQVCWLKEVYVNKIFEDFCKGYGYGYGYGV